MTAGWHTMARPVDIKLLGEYSFIIVAAENSNITIAYASARVVQQLRVLLLIYFPQGEEVPTY